MNEQRGCSLPESHLLPDAVVAFVDAELSLGAHERAAAHLARCPACAAEVTAQRQARRAVRGAQAPAMSAGFLASLRSIPDDTEIVDLPGTPDNLAVTDDGELVAVQRPEKLATKSEQVAPLGSSTPLGQSGRILGGGWHSPHLFRRRTAQGAGVVVSGAVLSAIALVVSGSLGTAGSGGPDGTAPPPPAPDVLRAQFNVPSSPTPEPSRTKAQPARTKAPGAASATAGTAEPAPTSTSVTTPAPQGAQR